MNFKTKPRWALPVLLGALLLSTALADAQTTFSSSNQGGMSGSGGMNMNRGSGMSTGTGGGYSGMPSPSPSPSPSGMGSASTGMAGNPGGASGASGSSGMNNTAGGSGSAGSVGQKSAHPLKKVKVTHPPAVPDKYADYQWGASDNGDSSSLYQPKWSTPQDDYAWGATPP